MTHDQLLLEGYELCRATDANGQDHTGYWMPGDGYGDGYGTFVGRTPEEATVSIEG